MKHVTIEKVVLFLAAGYAAYNFGLAGGYIEGIHISPGGVIAGLVVNVSLAIAASRYGSLKGDKRTRQAQVAFLAMLLLSPLLVAPVIYYSLPKMFLGFWWLRAIWSMGWPLVADLAIVLAGAVSGKGLISLGAEQSAPHSEGSTEGSAPSAVSVRSHSKRSTSALHDECAALAVQYACKEAECGWKPDVDTLIARAKAGGSARNAAASSKAGHAKNKHPKPIPVAETVFDPKKAGEK